MARKRIVVGISGATGFQYGYKALELLKPVDVEVHLVVSRGAQKVRQLETNYTEDEVVSLADVVHQIDDLGASIASGSFETIGMLIAPCSMRSLAAIAHAFTDNLLTRAADVVLKDRRRLVLMARETPLNLAHINNMRQITEMGGIIFPPVPALYNRPDSVDQIVTHSVGRALDFFGLGIKDIPRWKD
ncbi:UbiX family flavin prenyltransferase [Neisseria sp. Ec49-e6-T10]|uniref:UbiX family flavin prenyltransferase n=1 Tax=Neisseria sp. Ec49-e6-T10 TaxID=3140744 RepID=UPI003EC14119